MGEVAAFLNVDRVGHDVRGAQESVLDFEDIVLPITLDAQCEQASRCMNCGVAFCQSGIALGASSRVVGCPLHNLIPETNDLLYRKRFDDAVARLALTNPFPEFTGRVCPAPCETACNLGLHKDAVTINDNERALSDIAWEQGAVQPLAKPADDAPVASVIGSGPAGLTMAWELARHGWKVRVYERADRPGGLLMYGIPNMKLPKWVIDRRIKLMEESGIEFACNCDALERADEIMASSDAVVLATGATVARDVNIDGRDLNGIHFAVEYLEEATRALLDGRAPALTAEGKDVVVLGGGDTGTDCVATALRQGANSVTQVIRAPRPADEVDGLTIWPAPRRVFSQDYGQREAESVHGSDPRRFSTDTIAFHGIGDVEGVEVQELSYDGERHLVEGTQETIPAQLVLIAKGFEGGNPDVFDAFGVEPPVKDAPSHRARSIDESVETATPVYVTGDALQGASLVVSAMADALECAEEIMANKGRE